MHAMLCRLFRPAVLVRAASYVPARTAFNTTVRCTWPEVSSFRSFRHKSAAVPPPTSQHPDCLDQSVLVAAGACYRPVAHQKMIRSTIHVLKAEVLRWRLKRLLLCIHLGCSQG